ncbi:hypothetical protein NLS1_34330 [Nocardioides sp. LS1]|nr:hypothetical protein NLS1_34330 [Nocardioides sp. LS1]
MPNVTIASRMHRPVERTLPGAPSVAPIGIIPACGAVMGVVMGAPYDGAGAATSPVGTSDGVVSDMWWFLFPWSWCPSRDGCARNLWPRLPRRCRIPVIHRRGPDGLAAASDRAGCR